MNERLEGLKTLRVIIALILFVGGWMGWLWWQKAPRNNTDAPAIAEKMASDDAFFYHQIGVAPTVAEEVREPSEAELTGFTIEVGREANPIAAEKRVDELQSQGVEAFFTPLHQKGKVFYRVRVGVFPTEEIAKQAAGSLAKEKNLVGNVARL